MDPLKRKVNIMRLLLILPISILMLFSIQASAADKSFLIGTPLSKSQPGKQEKKWYTGYEIGELKIRQSNDGTGIIKEVSCRGCDYQFVKITPDTKVIVNEVEVDLLRARERAGEEVYIKFDRDTAEVKYIYWTVPTSQPAQ